MKSAAEQKAKQLSVIPFLVFLVAMVGVSLWMIAPYLLPLIMGGLLALLTMPFYNLLIGRRVPPKAAAAIVTACTVLLVIFPLGLFTSLAIKQGVAIGKTISETQSFSLQEFISGMSGWSVVETLELSPTEVDATVHEWIKSAGATGTALLIRAVGSIPRIALQLALSIIACFFLLLDGKRFFIWLRSRVFLDEDVQRKVAHSFKNMAVASVWAMLATGSAQSAVILLGFALLSVPGAFLAGGATFIFAFVPLVGCGPVWITGAIYLYVQGEIGKVIAMIVFGLFASIIDNIIRPLVLKGRSDMHPLVSLVAIFGGLGLFGIIGVFLGPILLAVSISLLQIWPDVAKRFGLA